MRVFTPIRPILSTVVDLACVQFGLTVGTSTLVITKRMSTTKTNNELTGQVLCIKKVELYDPNVMEALLYLRSFGLMDPDHSLIAQRLPSGTLTYGWLMSSTELPPGAAIVTKTEPAMESRRRLT